jgi:hypothetical protein
MRSAEEVRKLGAHLVACQEIMDTKEFREDVKGTPLEQKLTKFLRESSTILHTLLWVMGEDTPQMAKNVALLNALVPPLMKDLKNEK